MAKIKLQVMGMADTKSEYSVCLLMLDEVDGRRKLPLLISELEAQSILIALKQHKVERPLTHDLMITMLAELRAKITEVYIYKVENEVFYSYIIINDMGRQVIIDSRTSDAIALAVRTRCPIYVEEEILSEVQDRIIIKHSDNAPIEVLTDEELQERMEQMVQNEDYETAAKIRDEIQKRILD